MLVTMPVACNGGASAYHLLGDVAEELDAVGAIVEVGSDRGEGSTNFLSGLANQTRRPFFSVDFSEQGFLNARRACGSCAHRVTFVLEVIRTSKDTGSPTRKCAMCIRSNQKSLS